MILGPIFNERRSPSWAHLHWRWGGTLESLRAADDADAYPVDRKRWSYLVIISSKILKLFERVIYPLISGYHGISYNPFHWTIPFGKSSRIATPSPTIINPNGCLLNLNLSLIHWPWASLMVIPMTMHRDRNASRDMSIINLQYIILSVYRCHCPVRFQFHVQ